MYLVTSWLYRLPLYSNYLPLTVIAEGGDPYGKWSLILPTQSPLKHQGSETSRQYPQDQSQNEGQARGRGRAFPAQLPAHGRDWQRQSLR